MTPVYDSRHPACKQPFGAVATGQEVRFSIYLPKIQLDDNPVLKLFRMDETEALAIVPMRLEASSYVDSRYTCVYYPDEAALLVYYFELISEDRLIRIQRDADGVGRLEDGGQPWQLTVYDSNMRTPRFLQEGVMYHVFPDRFYNSETPKENVPEDRLIRGDWGALPNWRPNAQGKVTNSDYFGGDLRGIMEKLDYIQSLGVTALYLNPIFEAHSNHRYNTANYRKVDPLLGTNEDFAALCRAARERGIAVILDGVFSHIGSDSIYFNREKRYRNRDDDRLTEKDPDALCGACNDPDSPYFSWFRFTEYPEEYESWWGFDTLPNVDECNESYLEFICGEDGILRHWIRLGASGFRLDVADELPDEFLDALRRCVKSENPDCAIIGEVWEDASNKLSYGVRRRYLLGGQLDSVMNYPFRDAIISWVRDGKARELYDTVMQVLENYPPESIRCLMNSLSTHDTIRALTALVGELPPRDRQWQEWHHYLDMDVYLHGCRMLSLACIIQFGLPGMPCVYYGDEAGLSGYLDPFNRCCYPWRYENRELLAFFRKLGSLRRQYPIFSTAKFVPLSISADICCFIRSSERHDILFAVNRSKNNHVLACERRFTCVTPAIQFGQYEAGRLGPMSGVVLVTLN